MPKAVFIAALTAAWLFAGVGSTADSAGGTPEGDAVRLDGALVGPGIRPTGGEDLQVMVVGQAVQGRLAGRGKTLHVGFIGILLGLGCAGGADLDLDGGVDLFDYSLFSNCVRGPGQPFEEGCQCADLDEDGDVDLLDWADMQVAFGGS